MNKYMMKILVFSSIIFVMNNLLFAQNFGLKQQRYFFCQLEKFDQCFYTGECSKKDYFDYTIYFNNLTNFISVWAIDLYKIIPKIYIQSNSYEVNNSKNLKYSSMYVSHLASHYIKAKYDWFSWFKNKSGISYLKPKNIFSLYEQNRCGAKMFKKYLSLPLPEDADFDTCFFNYTYILSECSALDKDLEENLFCKSTNKCN